MASVPRAQPAADAHAWTHRFWVRSQVPRLTNQGNESKALDVMTQKMRCSKHTCEDVLQLFQQRAAIEEEYGRRLEKLSLLALGMQESAQSSLKLALDGVRSELQTSAVSRLHLAAELRQELEQKVATLIVTQATIRKPLQASAEKLHKAKSAQLQQLKHAKDALDTASNNLAQVVLHVQQRLLQATTTLDTSINLSLDDQKQLHATIERARAQQKSAASEYQLAVNKAHDLASMWDTEWTNSLAQFQKLEADRIAFLKASFWAYTNMLSVVGVADDDGCERMRGALEKIDIDRDMGAFARQFGTGSKESRSPAFPDLASRAIDVRVDPSVPVVSVAIGRDASPSSVTSALTTKQLQEMHKKRMLQETPAALPVSAVSPVSPISPVSAVPALPVSAVPALPVSGTEEARTVVPPRKNSGTSPTIPPQPTPAPPDAPRPAGTQTAQVMPNRASGATGGFAPRLSSLKARTPSPHRCAADAPVVGKTVAPPPRNPSLRKSLSRKASAPQPVRAPTPATTEENPLDTSDEEGYDPYDLHPKPILCWVRVAFPYVSRAFEELTIERGVVMPVVGKQDDGWWEGELDDGTGRLRRGLFPSNFVTQVPKLNSE